jgi:hypothetical protein
MWRVFREKISSYTITCFTVSIAVTVSSFAYSQDFAGDFITLPVVRVDGTAYAIELKLQGSNPQRFQVTRATRTTQGAQDSATFSFGDGILRIPALRAAGKDYSVQMRLLGSNPYVFAIDFANGLNGAADAGTALPRTLANVAQGYAVLPDARGGLNYEPVALGNSFDRAASLAAFRETLYPLLRSSTCVACHNSAISTASGAQAPLHTDADVELAHEYALTRVNFADPEKSRFVVRMAIDRHNCPRSDCAAAAADVLTAINAWKARIGGTVSSASRLVAAGTTITTAQVEEWIAQDKAQLSAADKPYIVYTSMHELHNEGLGADELNIVRVALSKALNSVARWAPAIVNPVDVNGMGILYKFDIRNYWGWNKGVKSLLFGGSDDDLAFGRNKRDFRGTLVSGSNVQQQRYNFTSTATWDPEFSLKIWERVLHGNVEGAVTNGTIPPYINGFRGKRSTNAAGEYIEVADFEWVETAQLIYTLTRPDVYNAIMLIPMTSVELESELGVDKSLGMDSYDYVVTYDAITIDSRLLWRARRADGGWYWKTWDIFTGQLAAGDRNIHDVYLNYPNDIRFPWWANPIPVFVDPQVNRKDTTTWSFIASLAQPFASTPAQIPAGCDPQANFSGISGFYNCRHFTGTGGLQQSASEIIWNLPNGLQGYMLTGAFNQRRVDAFVNIVRDPRVVPNARDNITTQTGFAFNKVVNGRTTVGGFNDPRLNVGSSCIGCHIDGMNRLNNDLRDWLDESPSRLPKGQYGVDGWINDPATVARVRDLYPPSSVVRGYVEEGRKTFLGSMAQIKQAMILGADKNIYVEPVIWTVEYVQRQKYRYPQTTSN